jgi:hypothetical protein
MVRNAATTDAATIGESTPFAVSTSKASTLSSVNGRFARTARVHDDHRRFATTLARKPPSAGSATAASPGSPVGRTSELSPCRSIAGSWSGTNPGAINPALPHEAPPATPARSTTVTSTPRSCRNQAVDKPTMPPPTTIADPGPGWLRSAVTTSAVIP